MIKRAVKLNELLFPVFREELNKKQNVGEVCRISSIYPKTSLRCSTTAKAAYRTSMSS
jgi:hypothetical protein